MLRTSLGSLYRWGQHCAPASAPATVHHAPGRAGCSGCSRRHQLCLRSPPQLLQLLRQLHESGGALQPHEPGQQRPVSSGRWPQPSSQDPAATKVRHLQTARGWKPCALSCSRLTVVGVFVLESGILPWTLSCALGFRSRIRNPPWTLSCALGFSPGVTNS